MIHVWAYGLCNRPPMPGAVPRGFLPVPGAASTPDFTKTNRFGVLYYESPLSDDDVYRYELLPMGEDTIEDPTPWLRAPVKGSKSTQLTLNEEGWDVIAGQIDSRNPIRAALEDIICDCQTWGLVTVEVGDYGIDERDLAMLSGLADELCGGGLA